jgi:prepilin-type N-terminal cleavage/methylation domain-containing protein
MDCKITSTPKSNNRRAGYTVVEMLIAVGVGSIIMAAVLSTVVFAAKSFAVMGNYCAIDNMERGSLDRISRDIRQADALTNFTANTLVFQTTDPNTGKRQALTFTYSPKNRTLQRTLGTETEVLMTDCTSWHFNLYQRNPTTNGSLVSLILTNRPDLAKAVDISWVCSRSVLGKTFETENVQSSKIVIRKD